MIQHPFSNIHKTHLRWALIVGLALLSISLMSACSAGPSATAEQIKITISDQGQTQQVQVTNGTTVQEALAASGILLNSLDEVDPPAYSVLTGPTIIEISRITETFESEQVVIPFEQQTVRNESLTEGESLLIQPGKNGSLENTYRILSKDGVQTSRTLIKSDTVEEAVPEIIMVGVQTPFTPQPINGRLAYLSGGNAWIMEETTSQRQPVVTTGDLDGRVFALSPNGNWLLYTRAEPDGDFNINSLWVTNLNEDDPQPSSLGIYNVISYAGWDPAQNNVIFFSTVEPRDTAPGWQANNDLIRIVINSAGNITQSDTWIEPNSGGIYGWWGTTFSIAPDGTQIAYSRPDSIGLVDAENNELKPLIDILPFQTRSEWAWVPGIAWSPDGQVLYYVAHQPKTGVSDSESSPLFDLAAVISPAGPSVDLISQTGMFAYPSLSPAENGIAYLEAIFPEQSDSSRYRLVVMDRDGSNKVTIFPPDGSAGIEPQMPVWSPAADENGDNRIAIIYQGNIFLIDVETKTAQQITGDGLISNVDWK
jgi:hypothetical protein